MDPSPFLFGLYKLVKYLVYPFTWLCIMMGSLTLLTLLRVSPRRLRWIRALAVLSSLLIFLLGLPVVAGTLLGLVETRAVRASAGATGPFDAIVVLGAGVRGKGSLRPQPELTDQSIRRTICGADLYDRGLAPRLVLAGGDASIFGEGPLEAVEMRRLARRLGVPRGAIVLEAHSRTTYENAVQTKRLLDDASVLVVTSAGHLARATALFRKQGMQTTGYPCGYEARNRPWGWDGDPFDLIPNVEALEASTTAVTELVGTVVYRVIGKL